MDIDKLIDTLHPLERKILPVLDRYDNISDISKNTGLQKVEVMRALQWLQNKDIITLKEDLKELISLDTHGKKYLKEKLPENKFLETIKSKPLSLDEIKQKSELRPDEFNVSLGILKSKAAIEIKKDKGVKVAITSQGKEFLKKESLEEQFLKKTFPLNLKEVKDQDKFAFDNLKKRKKIIRVDLVKEKIPKLTSLGQKIIKKGIKSKNVIDNLSSDILKTGEWQKKKFRRYDVKINVPEISGGKPHFVNQAIHYAKRIWMDMGFEEMVGPMVDTSFWVFDSLFTPQDHPVREMQDTFFIKNQKLGKLPNTKLVDAVKKSHENGCETGSTGWQYKWTKEEAMKNVLRTHTTSLSARTLANLKKDDLPAKFFAVGKCFRNEAINWSHLFEFNQTEGIVVDPDANFRHLLGYLKEFFSKMGFEKARFRPAFFSYTEPSVEIDVFHPGHKKWIELGGAGMFRPEVVKPLLGFECPVLAWGPGFDRIILDYYKILDIRDLYKNNLKQLRTTKTWLK